MIELIKVTPLDNAGNLKAFAAIRVGSADRWIQINNIRVIQQPNQKAWVSLPQEAREVGGAKKYYPVCEASDAVLADIRKIVLDGYQATGRPV